MEVRWGLHKRTDTGFWQITWVDACGKRRRRSLGVKSKAKALQKAQELQALGLVGNSEGVVFGRFSEPFYIWETCPLVKQKLARGGSYTRQTIKNNRSYLENYMIPHFRDMELDSITPAVVDRWLLSLPKAHGITPQTANKAFYSLSRILDEAKARNLIRSNPCGDVKPLIEAKVSREAFTDAEVRRILARMEDQMVRLMCRLAACTGMRMGEIRALRPEQMLSGDRLMVNASYSDTDGLKGTKSGKGRIVPVPHGVVEELQELGTCGGWFFSIDGRLPISKNTVASRLRDTGATKTFHSFRHYFNSKLVEAGVQGESIRAVVGHESEEMTELYLDPNAIDWKMIRKVQERII